MEEMILEDHVVRFVAAFVDSLDLSELGLRQNTAPRGALEYDVRVLLSAWVYGFMTRVRSTRRLEQLAYENLPMIWLLGGQRPDHSTLARFLQNNLQAIKNLFKQTVRTAVQVGLVDFAFQAIDGTRVANVSRDKALRRKELLTLNEKLERVLAEMEQGTEPEQESGEGDSHRMPQALANPEALHEQVQAALKELDRREARRRTFKKGALDPETGEPKGPPVSLADPEAVLMKGRGGYVLGYNAQAAVDARAQVIVAAEVVADATDNDQQVLMLRETEETAGRLAEVTALDGGYHSAENLEATQELATDLYVTDPALRRAQAQPETSPFHKDAFRYQAESDTYLCPERHTLRLEYQSRDKRHGGRVIRVYRCHECHTCPHFGLCTKDRHGRGIRIRQQEHLLRRHRDKMGSETANAYMKQRAAVVEPVFGILKEHLGLRRFLRRGLENVRAEWQLLCAAYNLRKLWRYQAQACAVPIG
jgi:transposase